MHTICVTLGCNCHGPACLHEVLKLNPELNCTLQILVTIVRVVVDWRGGGTESCGSAIEGGWVMDRVVVGGTEMEDKLLSRCVAHSVCVDDLL